MCFSGFDSSGFDGSVDSVALLWQRYDAGGIKRVRQFLSECDVREESKEVQTVPACVHQAAVPYFPFLSQFVFIFSLFG